MIGDTLPSATGFSATFSATVQNLDEARAARPGAYFVAVYRDALPVLTLPIPPSGDEFSFDFPALGYARYRLQVQREGAIEAISSPIWVEPASGEPPPPPTRLQGRAGDPAWAMATSASTARRRPTASRAGAAPIGSAARTATTASRAGRGRDRMKGDAGEDILKGGGGSDRIRAQDGEPTQFAAALAEATARRSTRSSTTSVGCERIASDVRPGVSP